MSDFTVAVKEHGRMNLPRSLRTALNVQDGDHLVFRVTAAGVADVIAASTLARRSKGLFAHLKREESETDAFLAERRTEIEE